MNNEEVTTVLLKIKNRADSYEKKCINKAVEALEKQIPRKPKVEGSGTLYYVCPECGKALLIGYPCKCGQLIDWEW